MSTLPQHSADNKLASTRALAPIVSTNSALWFRYTRSWNADFPLSLN